MVVIRIGVLHLHILGIGFRWLGITSIKGIEKELVVIRKDQLLQ